MRANLTDLVDAYHRVGVRDVSERTGERAVPDAERREDDGDEEERSRSEPSEARELHVRKPEAHRGPMQGSRRREGIQLIRGASEGVARPIGWERRAFELSQSSER